MNHNIECFCPNCGKKIFVTIEKSGKINGRIAGGLSGAILGSKIGIVAGPLGAAAGTIPGADDTFDNFPEITGNQPTKWVDFIAKHQAELDY